MSMCIYGFAFVVAAPPLHFVFALGPCRCRTVDFERKKENAVGFSSILDHLCTYCTHIQYMTIMQNKRHRRRTISVSFLRQPLVTLVTRSGMIMTHTHTHTHTTLADGSTHTHTHARTYIHARKHPFDISLYCISIHTIQTFSYCIAK